MEMRRKKVHYPHRVMISVSEKTYQELDRVSEETGVSLSKVGRHALLAGLNKAERELKRTYAPAPEQDTD